MSVSDDDEPLTLSSHTLAALQEFKLEEKSRLEKFQTLFKQSENNFDNKQKLNHQNLKLTIDDFKEDWQLSQFWYSDETASTLGKALLEGADENTIIVIASAPSVYAAIKQFPKHQVPTDQIYLLEFDPRFKILAGDEKFAIYDYNKPDEIPKNLRYKCHRLLIDPPFLEEECQTKSAIAAKNLLIKDDSNQVIKLITSTGERMNDIVKKIYPDTFMTNYYPEHKNGLSNEFRCYANFECSYWQFQD
ncbi:unnamed protein product [Candida verbasci]|uniref:Protein-lysine N-methyltransferase EFM5 n=1 Tax=Candida verbasci TaxID=1227364 RepID=A0A9W4TZQ9_9ASCO|nr:unnamed protein product [Candida verbasci]